MRIDCRIIAATNKDLQEGIRAGTFREDLFYRLNIVSIHVPPLRERREDIPLLIKQLTLIQAKQMNRQEPVYSARSLEKLLDYAWPGNVRELENLVKRLVILRAGEPILADDIEKILEFAQSQGQSVSGELTTSPRHRAAAHHKNARKDSWGAWRQKGHRQDFRSTAINATTPHQDASHTSRRISRRVPEAVSIKIVDGFCILRLENEFG